MYKLKLKKDDEVYNISFWKIPFKQEATVKMGSKTAIYIFTKAGAEFKDGDTLPAEFEEKIKVAIMQYCFNRRIHK